MPFPQQINQQFTRCFSLHIKEGRVISERQKPNAQSSSPSSKLKFNAHIMGIAHTETQKLKTLSNYVTLRLSTSALLETETVTDLSRRSLPKFTATIPLFASE
jgi:hypothetical protein